MTSPRYTLVKTYYDRGLWSLERVHTAVGLWITEGEYKQITGKTYKR